MRKNPVINQKRKSKNDKLTGRRERGKKTSCIQPGQPGEQEQKDQKSLQDRPQNGKGIINRTRHKGMSRKKHIKNRFPRHRQRDENNPKRAEIKGWILRNTEIQHLATPLDIGQSRNSPKVEKNPQEPVASISATCVEKAVKRQETKETQIRNPHPLMTRLAYPAS
jgi:hypothetical protein